MSLAVLITASIYTAFSETVHQLVL